MAEESGGGGLDLRVGWYLSTTDGVKCWMLKNRWTSKLIKLGLWVKSPMPRMRENTPPRPSNLWEGEGVILNQCVSLNFMLLQDVWNFAVNKVSLHSLAINNTVHALLFMQALLSKWHVVIFPLHPTNIFTWSCALITMHYYAPTHHEAFTNSFVLSGFSLAMPFILTGAQNKHDQG